MLYNFNEHRHLHTAAINVRDLITSSLLLTKISFSPHSVKNSGIVVPKLISTSAYRQKNNVIARKSSLIKYSSRHARRFWKLQVKHLTFFQEITNHVICVCLIILNGSFTVVLLTTRLVAQRSTWKFQVGQDLPNSTLPLGVNHLTATISLGRLTVTHPYRK